MIKIIALTFGCEMASPWAAGVQPDVQFEWAVDP